MLTNHAPEPLPMDGGTTFHFVTGGIEHALEEAKAAAGDKNVRIGGGAAVVQRYLAAGLLDELQIHVVPVLLGDGVRLFDGADALDVRFEPERVVASLAATHLKYRLAR